MEPTNSNAIEQLKQSKKGIKVYQVAYSLREVITLLNEGALQKSEFNRDEVKARAGNADELFLTLAQGQGMGSVYASWDGVGVPKLTAAQPAKISEAGHRVMSWIPKIRDGQALLHGQSLSAIQQTDPDLYKQIMDYQIVIRITTHESGVVPVSYMKEEYMRCNIMTASLTNGEVLRASENTHVNELVDRVLTEVFKEHKGLDKRENQREMATALVCGALHGVDAMNTKDELIETVSLAVTPEKYAAAKRIIEAYIDIDEGVRDDFLEEWPEEQVPRPPAAGASKADIKAHVKAEKERIKLEKTMVKDRNKMMAAQRKRFTDRACSLAFDGVLLWGLINTRDLQRAKRDIVKFYNTALSDKATWAAKLKEVCEAGPGNTARNFNARRFEHGWGKLQSIVNPRAVTDGVGGGGGGRIIA
jgi:hypothetical protein